jgi:putative polyhydroxyalkanoate system protein
MLGRGPHTALSALPGVKCPQLNGAGRLGPARRPARRRQSRAGLAIPGQAGLHCRDDPCREPSVSNIDIHAHHALSHQQALRAADELAADLAEKFNIDYGWEGDTIHFERPGVHGQIVVQNSALRIQAYLGFLLVMLKGPIEREIVRYLEEHFGCTF